jgi:hypothetical protein
MNEDYVKGVGQEVAAAYVSGFMEKLASCGVDVSELQKCAAGIPSNRLAELIENAVAMLRKIDPKNVGYPSHYAGKGFVMPDRGLAYRPPLKFKPRHGGPMTDPVEDFVSVGFGRARVGRSSRPTELDKYLEAKPGRRFAEMERDRRSPWDFDRENF